MKPLSLIAMAVLLATFTVPVVAQERGYPVLNSIGRFWGAGYTRGGYHAGVNGQLQIVKQNHPAHQYSSNALLYPYQSGYAAASYNYGSRGMPTQQGSSSLQEQIAAPTQAPVPVGPTPQWLKPYLQDDNSGQPDADKGELLTPPAAGRGKSEGQAPFYFDSGSEASPSDSLLDEGSGEKSIDEKDSLLWLESDDFLPQPLPLLRPQTAQRAPIMQPALNRYRQAAAVANAPR